MVENQKKKKFYSYIKKRTSFKKKEENQITAN